MRPSSGAPVAASPAIRPGQHVVGDGQHGQVGAAENLAGVGDDRAGEVRVRPAQRGVRHRGRGHDLVAGAGERRAERGARSPGADDADREPGRVPGGRIGSRSPGMGVAIRVHQDCGDQTRPSGRRGNAAPPPLECQCDVIPSSCPQEPGGHLHHLVRDRGRARRGCAGRLPGSRAGEPRTGRARSWATVGRGWNPCPSGRRRMSTRSSPRRVPDVGWCDDQDSHDTGRRTPGGCPAPGEASVVQEPVLKPSRKAAALP